MLAANWPPPLLASEERVDSAPGPGPPPGPPPPHSSRSGESQLSGGGGGGGSGLSAERLRRCYGSVPSPRDGEQRARRPPLVVSERPGPCGTREELLDEPEWTHPSTQRRHLRSVRSPGRHPPWPLGRTCHVPKAQGSTSQGPVGPSCHAQVIHCYFRFRFYDQKYLFILIFLHIV